MQIPLVKGIEIELAACPFADSPVGQFTKPPDFAERGWYLVRLRQKYLERATFDETGLAGQLSSICRRMVLARFKPDAACGFDVVCTAASDRLPEFLDGPTDRRSCTGGVSRSAARLRSGQRSAQANCDGWTALVQELPREQRRAQCRVHTSRGVEPSRVRAIDERGQHLRARRQHQAANCRSPRRVDARAGWSAPVRHLAGREDHKRSAILQPEMCRAQSGLAASAGRRSAEGIHEETQLRQVRDAGEQMVRQNPHVRSLPAGRSRPTADRPVRRADDSTRRAGAHGPGSGPIFGLKPSAERPSALTRGIRRVRRDRIASVRTSVRYVRSPSSQERSGRAAAIAAR